MEAILFVGHGSRDPEGNEQLLAFTRRVEEVLRRQVDAALYETCFLELTTPTIPQGIARCVQRGATSVAVVPIMLFSAGHAKLHIPHEIDEAKAAYPHVQFRYGRPIGIHEYVVDILLDRLRQAKGGDRLDETAVLLVGRGSSDPDANSDLYKIGRLLWERAGVADVECAFMGVTRPAFREGLERCLRGRARRVVVLPYLLFTGVLIKRMHEDIAAFAADHPGMEVEAVEYLGFHERLADIVAERAVEALRGRAVANCDVCQFRQMAAHDHHHHDHHHHGDHNHGHHHDQHDHLHHHHHGHDHGHHRGTGDGQVQDGQTHPHKEVGV